jgi:hypothetical protein
MSTALRDPVAYSLAEGNYLRPNGLGGYVIRQSDISSWSYCQLRKYYEDQSRHDPEAPKPKVLSATAFGNVMHAAIMQMELAIHEGREDPLGIGTRFFEYYWNPANIAAIPDTLPVQEWLPRETWNGLLDRGRYVLRTHHANLATEKEAYLLALEYQFAVPLEVRGRIHTLTGTIDRLLIRRHYRKPYIGIDDLKTGRRPYYLRYNTQGGFYAYATTRAEFWTGWRESGVGELQTFGGPELTTLDERFASYGYRIHDGGDPELKLASRRFRWIDLKDMKMADGGWRVPQDYARLMLGVDAYVRAQEAEIYSINTDGQKCRHCPFREFCGGVGLPDESVGAP